LDSVPQLLPLGLLEIMAPMVQADELAGSGPS